MIFNKHTLELEHKLSLLEYKKIRKDLIDFTKNCKDSAKKKRMIEWMCGKDFIYPLTEKELEFLEVKS